MEYSNISSEIMHKFYPHYLCNQTIVDIAIRKAKKCRRGFTLCGTADDIRF